MPKKIFGLIINEIYPKELDRFVINDLRKENIDFFLVDISEIIHKKSQNKNLADIYIKSLSNLDSILEVNDYFILYFDYSLKYKKIYKLLLKHNKNKYFYIKNDPIPVNSSPYKNKLKLIFYNFKRLLRYPFLSYKFLDNKLKFLNPGTSPRSVFVSGVNDSGPAKNFLIPAFSKIGTLFKAASK